MDNSRALKTAWLALSAPVLAAGKGWVLAMLAMLAAKGRLRVAARGSGPGAKRRRPCPPLRAAAAWKASGRRASRRIDAKRACRPGVEQRAGEEEARRRPLPCQPRPQHGPQTRQERRTAASAHSSHTDTGQEADSPQSRPKLSGHMGPGYARASARNRGQRAVE